MVVFFDLINISGINALCIYIKGQETSQREKTVKNVATRCVTFLSTLYRLV
ncbi:hypothetical protein J6590_100750 [Homalodisca vitripennis]|nr:hypothetical protein J6590_100750 [Homalodisca vitripennis]